MGTEGQINLQNCVTSFMNDPILNWKNKHFLEPRLLLRRSDLSDRTYPGNIVLQQFQRNLAGIPDQSERVLRQRRLHQLWRVQRRWFQLDPLFFSLALLYRVCQRLWPSDTKISNWYFCSCFFGSACWKVDNSLKQLRHEHKNMARKCGHWIICNFAGMRSCLPERIFHFIRATIPGTPCIIFFIFKCSLHHHISIFSACNFILYIKISNESLMHCGAFLPWLLKTTLVWPSLHWKACV